MKRNAKMRSKMSSDLVESINLGRSETVKGSASKKSGKKKCRWLAEWIGHGIFCAITGSECKGSENCEEFEEAD